MRIRCALAAFFWVSVSCALPQSVQSFVSAIKGFKFKRLISAAHKLPSAAFKNSLAYQLSEVTDEDISRAQRVINSYNDELDKLSSLKLCNKLYELFPDQMQSFETSRHLDVVTIYYFLQKKAKRHP